MRVANDAFEERDSEDGTNCSILGSIFSRLISTQ